MLECSYCERSLAEVEAHLIETYDLDVPIPDGTLACDECVIELDLESIAWVSD